MLFEYALQLLSQSTGRFFGVSLCSLTFGTPPPHCRSAARNNLPKKGCLPACFRRLSGCQLFEKVDQLNLHRRFLCVQERRWTFTLLPRLEPESVRKSPNYQISASLGLFDSASRRFWWHVVTPEIRLFPQPGVHLVCGSRHNYLVCVVSLFVTVTKKQILVTLGIFSDSMDDTVDEGKFIPFVLRVLCLWDICIYSVWRYSCQ